MIGNVILVVVSWAFVALVGVLCWHLLHVLGELSTVLGAIHRQLEESFSGGAEDVETRFRDLEDLVDRLPQRWEEIKREASRLDGRARYAVTRAREELAERGLADERLEDLGRELQLVDGGGSPDGGVQPVREGVESVPQPDLFSPQPEPDWQSAARAVKFGG